MMRNFALLATRARTHASAGKAPLIQAEDARTRASIARHLPFVWRVLRRGGLSPAEAEEGAREVFARLAEHGKGAGQRAELVFLARTALSITAERMRFRGPWALVPANDVEPGETDDALLRDSLFLIDRALEELDVTDRAIFVFSELEALRREQVAAVLGLPRALVGTRLERARKRFCSAATRLIRARLLSQTEQRSRLSRVES